MGKVFNRMLSILLVLTMVFQLLPLNCFSLEVTADENIEQVIDTSITEPSSAEDTDSYERLETAQIVEEDISKRDESYKEFILNNGSRMAALYPSPVHYENDGQWEEIDNTLKASGANYVNTAGVWEVSFPQNLSKNNAVTIEKDGYTLSFFMAGELRSGSGNLEVAPMATIGVDEPFSVQAIQATPAQIQQIDASVMKAEMKHPEMLVEKGHSRLQYSNVYSGTNVVYDLSSNQVKESIVMQSYSANLRGYRYTLNVGELRPVLTESGEIQLYDRDGENVIMVMPAPFLVDNAGEYTFGVDVTLTGIGSVYTLTYLLPQSWLENTTSTSSYRKQFYSANYSASMCPSLTITFRNVSGLEDYWDYTISSAGRAGTGYVNKYSGNLIWVHEDIGLSGNRMPISISHIFNSNDSTVNQFGLGNGWRTNFNQSITATTHENSNSPYIWEDGDGTKHYFYYDSASSAYKDEDGLGLTLEVSSNGYEITDKYGNLSRFDSNGNADTWPYQIGYTYDTLAPGRPSRVSSVSEISNGQIGRKVSMVYRLHNTTFTDQDEKVEIAWFNNWGNMVSLQDDEGRAVFTYYDADERKPEGETSAPNQLEVSSKLIATSSNMIPDSSFECGTLWDAPSNNSASVVTMNSGTGENEENVWLGSKAMYLSVNATGVVYASSFLAAPGESYTFSAYVKCTTEEVKLRINASDNVTSALRFKCSTILTPIPSISMASSYIKRSLVKATPMTATVMLRAFGIQLVRSPNTPITVIMN